ncbi:WD40-repeat-containing domain protein [Crepidotus variabilis]|uniref:WD40-repeat-containing domain protein n=1 Tax=Crepidotus variabilis TaxID=179855 RepID=A0A9P6EDE7_9AGAR|nr:WD40-repeat-containing domain protein [Crepidotus variabilis]
MQSFFKDFMDGLRGSSPANNYRLVATLAEPEGAINALAFNPTGTSLASDGDDETVRIWDLASFKCVQALSDIEKQWGQITVLKFAQMGPDVSTEWLCFGTGFGMFVVYRRARKSTYFVELLRLKVFTSGDSVESFSFNPHFRRLAVGSHNGTLKVFELEGNGRDLTLLWDDRYDDMIIQSLVFVDQGEHLNIYIMASGDVICRNTDTGEQVYAKRLQSPIGHAEVHHPTVAVVIENMTNGFDLYPFNKPTPSRNFPVETNRLFIKSAVFAENGKIIVTGSDHGKVYIFGTTSSTALQVLKHGGREQLVQVVEVT